MLLHQKSSDFCPDWVFLCNFSLVNKNKLSNLFSELDKSIQAVVVGSTGSAGSQLHQAF